MRASRNCPMGQLTYTANRKECIHETTDVLHNIAVRGKGNRGCRREEWDRCLDGLEGANFDCPYTIKVDGSDFYRACVLFRSQKTTRTASLVNHRLRLHSRTFFVHENPLTRHANNLGKWRITEHVACDLGAMLIEVTKQWLFQL